MEHLLKEIAGGTSANMYFGIELAFRLIDILVAKGVLTKPEASATFYALADGIRKDADEHEGARSAVEAIASSLEKTGNQYRADLMGGK